MSKLFRLPAFIIFFAGISFYSNVFACRYTVREIGFSDIGSLPYTVYFYYNSDVKGKDISIITNMSILLLDETNIKFEAVNIEEENDPDILKYLEKHKINSFPSVVFVSPSEESVEYSFNSDGSTFAESAWKLLEDIVSSPARETLINEILQSYCVILIIEGDDESKYKNAIDEANAAVREISGILDKLPKPVSFSPSIQVLRRKNYDSERIFLMSLGLEGKEVETSVAIIYGRGRILGSLLLQDEMINGKTIFNSLSIVGADCECGLDQTWILGKMIPLQWNSPTQSKLVDLLGFDVENPLIKTEMSHIVSLNMETESFIDPLKDNLFRSLEEKIEVIPESQIVSKIRANDLQNSFTHKNSSERNPFSIILIIGIGAVFFTLLLAGIIIFFFYF